MNPVRVDCFEVVSPFLEEGLEDDDTDGSLDCFDVDDRLDEGRWEGTGNFEVVMGGLGVRVSAGVRWRVGICEKSIGLTILSKPPARRRVKVVTGASLTSLISSLGDIGEETCSFASTVSLGALETTCFDVLMSCLDLSWELVGETGSADS